MNYRDIQNMSDEEVADLNKKLSSAITKGILQMVVVRILFSVGFYFLLKWMNKRIK